VERNARSQTLRRRAMILVTDGEDRSSYYTSDQLFNFLGQHDVQIFVIGFTKALKGKAKDKAVALLTRLANDTGGRVFLPTFVSELASIAKEITRDIRTQYVIGYSPIGGAPNLFHKVSVSVVETPGSEKKIAITRVGYSIPRK
jgi:Ca-activated chloride channel family protein